MSLALGIIGTVVALGGLGFTWLERRDRQRGDEAERRERVEQINLLRRQVQASETTARLEEAAHEASLAAEVRVKRGGRDGLGWSFDLVNTGRGAASAVRAWMVNAETGSSVGVTLELPGPMLPGESTSDRRLKIPLAEDYFSGGPRPPLALMIAWKDTRERERRDDHPIDL